MNVFYINLAAAVERNAVFLRNIEAGRFSDAWSFHRFEALPVTSAQVERTAGGMPSALKSNYLSHVECIRLACQYEGHALIAEDDNRFCREAEYYINLIVNSLPPDSWDVMYTDVTVASASDMMRLLKRKKACVATSIFDVINVAQWGVTFAGSNSYIINERSKQKVLAALESNCIDAPYDLVLRENMLRQKLTGIVVFPFISCVCEAGDFSQVNSDDVHIQHLMYNLFRRLVWIGGHDDENATAALRAIARSPADEDVSVLCGILSHLLPIEISWQQQSS